MNVIKSPNRRQYSVGFKAWVALEPIRGAHTINEIASRFEVHPNWVTQWKLRYSGTKKAMERVHFTFLGIR